MQGRFADIYPDVSMGAGRFMLSRTAWQRLQAAGIQDLFAVPIAVQSRRKAPDQYVELQIEHAARRLAFTNIRFEPVRTDGSEATQGLARAQASRPELWSSPQSKPCRKRRAAGAKPTAKAVRSMKTPPFPAIDSVLRSPALRGQATALRALARPCLRLTVHPAARIPVGASRFGGLPDLPKGVTWPGARGIQLDFVVQLNCADLSRALPSAELPASGWLWFFYDVEHSPTGLMSEEKDLWAVRYWDGPLEALSPAPAPAWWVESTAFPSCQLTVQPGEWLPDAKDPVVRALQLKPAEAQAYGGALKKLRGPENTPLHKAFGWPDTIQNAMEADCRQRVGRGDWRLLLQLDSDGAAHLMWGDSGRLYLWIRREDLQAKRFDRCWVLVQCY